MESILSKMDSQKERSSSPSIQKDQRAKNKRDRVPVSCVSPLVLHTENYANALQTRCHLKKKRCNRGTPCEECITKAKSNFAYIWVLGKNQKINSLQSIKLTVS
jgi:hypothetical protein